MIGPGLLLFLLATTPPPCAFDAGDMLLPDPCRVLVAGREWLTVRTPRIPPKRRTR